MITSFTVGNGDPGTEAKLALGELDALILAFLVFATSPIVRAYLCKTARR